MACLLWWVEGEVEQQKKKSGQYAFSMGSLSQQVEIDQQQALAACRWEDTLIPAPQTFKLYSLIVLFQNPRAIPPAETDK